MWWLNLFTFSGECVFNQKQKIRVRWCWFCWCRCCYHCWCCLRKNLIRMLIDMLLLFWPNQYAFFRHGWHITNEINWNTHCLWQNYDHRIIAHKSELTAKCQELRGGFNTHAHTNSLTHILYNYCEIVWTLKVNDRWELNRFHRELISLRNSWFLTNGMSKRTETRRSGITVIQLLLLREWSDKEFKRLKPTNGVKTTVTAWAVNNLEWAYLIYPLNRLA